MARKRTPRTQEAADFVSGGDLNSSMFWFGDLNVWGAFPTATTVYQKPRATVFYVTRNWFERSVFIKALTLLKFDIYNYGFKLQAANPPKPEASKAEREKWAKRNAVVEQWQADHQLVIANLVRDAWQEWNIQDNAVAVWCRNCPPVLHPIEHLSFADDFGIETLAFAHGLTPQKLAALPGLAPAVRRELTTSENLTIYKQGKTSSSKLFSFQAMRRTKVGMGLAWPQLRTLFNTVGMWESLEVADWQLADALRTVYELHKVGHEIKQGNRAGMPDHFLKPKRAAATVKMIKPDKGTLATIRRLVVNFDHDISYPRPASELFSADRYAAPLERMMLWAMPLAQMLFSKQVNPWHGLFLKAKAATERKYYVGPFLDAIFRECLDAPPDTTCTWSDDIFMDPRLLLDVLKTGLVNGPISQETFLEKTGHDAAQERRRKTAESDLPTEQVRPLWDGAHGLDPNDPTAGRPPGQGDRVPRKTKS